MFTMIGITGASGSGKTTSLRNMNPKETFIATRIRKALPFPHGDWKVNENYFELKSANAIVKLIKHTAAQQHIKYLVFDDWQYIAAYELFDRLDDKSFDKWTDLAGLQANLMRFLSENMRDDQIAILINHDDVVEKGGIVRKVIKTQGRMVSEKFTPEGLFTIHVFSEVIFDADNKRQYVFRVKPTAFDSVKVPMGLYDDDIETIPNDIMNLIDTYKMSMNA